MYFWRVKALEEDLKHQRVSEQQKMFYYTAGVVYGVLITYLYSLTPKPFTAGMALEVLLAVFVSVVGVRLCYSANKAGDDRNFLDRMICLSWPISVQLLAVLVPIQLLYMAYLNRTSEHDAEAYFEALLAIVFFIIYYKRLHSSISNVAAWSPTPTAAEDPV